MERDPFIVTGSHSVATLFLFARIHHHLSSAVSFPSTLSRYVPAPPHPTLHVDKLSIAIDYVPRGSIESVIERTKEAEVNQRANNRLLVTRAHWKGGCLRFNYSSHTEPL